RRLDRTETGRTGWAGHCSASHAAHDELRSPGDRRSHRGRVSADPEADAREPAGDAVVKWGVGSGECGVAGRVRAQALRPDAHPSTPHSTFRTPHWGRGAIGQFV